MHPESILAKEKLHLFIVKAILGQFGKLPPITSDDFLPAAFKTLQSLEHRRPVGAKIVKALLGTLLSILDVFIAATLRQLVHKYRDRIVQLFSQLTKEPEKVRVAVVLHYLYALIVELPSLFSLYICNELRCKKFYLAAFTLSSFLAVSYAFWYKKLDYFMYVLAEDIIHSDLKPEEVARLFGLLSKKKRSLQDILLEIRIKLGKLLFDNQLVKKKIVKETFKELLQRHRKATTLTVSLLETGVRMTRMGLYSLVLHVVKNKTVAFYLSIVILMTYNLVFGNAYLKNTLLFNQRQYKYMKRFFE